MRHVKGIVFILLICSLTSFIRKDKSNTGLNVGESAPDFSIKAQDYDKLSDMKGQYVLLSFWASYDASSRMQNVLLNNSLQNIHQDIKMVSVSFDEYSSVFQETVKQDGLNATCFRDEKGTDSSVYKKYRLNKGFTNYLLDGNGIIVAKNLTSAELAAYFN